MSKPVPVIPTKPSKLSGSNLPVSRPPVPKKLKSKPFDSSPENLPSIPDKLRKDPTPVVDPVLDDSDSSSDEKVSIAVPEEVNKEPEREKTKDESKAEEVKEPITEEVEEVNEPITEEVEVKEETSRTEEVGVKEETYKEDEEVEVKEAKENNEEGKEEGPKITTEEEKLKRPQDIRSSAAFEILDSERWYVNNDLYTIVNTYKKGLNNILPIETLNIIFGNIEVIYELNLQFLKDLEERLGNWNDEAGVGDLFISFAPFFRMYSQYVNNFDAARTTLDKLSTNTKYTAYLESIARHPSINGKHISFYLISPVQRVPRYRLLIERLMKETPEEHPDTAPLKQALETVQKVATHINEMVRQQENHHKILEIEELFGNCETFMSPGRRFVKQGILTKKSRKKDQIYTFFVFSDLLVYGTEATVSKYKLHQSIPIDNAFSIVDVPEEKGHNCIQILNTIKSITVSTSTAAEKTQWTELLQSLITEYKNKNDNNCDEQFVPPIWKQDTESDFCHACKGKFNALRWRHHCRKCGELCCDSCSLRRLVLVTGSAPERICDNCEVVEVAAPKKKVQKRRTIMNSLFKR